ncbi:MAG: alpha/beta fold hydrolase [Rhodospirillales bacterium]|nr:alpha/beta fold hydrolase [Rhodospirillales bacterium]
MTARIAASQPGTGGPIGPLSPSVLPPGIRSRYVDNVNGLRMHVLEAGYQTPGRPGILLIHGFPELAYSWRKIMGPLAAAGYHVFAPDMRGYGRTSPTPVNYDDDLRPYGTVNRLKDMLALVSAMGHRSLPAVFGHDQGSPLAGWCALARPDIFRSVVMMSAPFGGAPTLPFNTANVPAVPVPAGNPNAIYDELAKLSPPRKHYQRYYQTREANTNMWPSKQGMLAFFRAYYHAKSADWQQNKPQPLAARTAAEWAKLPRYYVMDLDKGMAEQVAVDMPTAAEIAANKWLPDAELAVYAEEYGRTGFQGGLNGYRGAPGGEDLQLFAGRTLDVPSSFISGKQDWGTYQNPGSLERLEKQITTKYRGTHLLDGAGHWVQQEQSAALSALLLEFVKKETR